LIDAAVELLGQREPTDISVTDLARRAGVSRPTFYQHVSGVNELFAAAAISRLTAMLDAIDTLGDDLATVPDAIAAMVSAFAADREFFRRALLGPSSHDVFHAAVALVADRLHTHALMPIIDASTTMAPADRYEAIAAAEVWLIGEWLHSDDADDTGRLVQRITDLVFTLAGVTTSPQPSP